MREKIIKASAYGLLATSLALSSCADHQPKQESEFKGVINKTFAESKEYWPEKKHAPKGAPNVIWFLIDDAGFGAASAFGGLAETPTIDDLANNGLRYTNFHTTAICSPSRASLLTGRNSHSVHMGLFPVTATGFPGYDGILPDDKATIAQILENYDKQQAEQDRLIAEDGAQPSTYIDPRLLFGS